MWTKIKIKIKQAWLWVKNKIKNISIILGIITIASAAGLGSQEIANRASLQEFTQKYEQSIEIKAKYQQDGNSLIKTDIKNAELDKYKGEPKDEIKITLGDKDKTEFVPNIELKRWNEVSFKIKPNLDGIATKDKELSFEGEKVKFNTPKISFEMYDYTEGEGGYKFIWYLNEKPATNKVEFQIESSGLDFFYQPPLTQEYQNGYSEQFQKEIVVSETQVKDLDGNVLVNRPENIVGSYVVYHSTKGGMNDINGKEYKVGKVFHIYRPHIIDAEGKETWGILHIENGIYSVEIPQEFLDKAVYPIKSNDNWGYEGAGGSADYVGNPDINGSLFTSPVNMGTITSISVSADGSGDDGLSFKGVIVLHSTLNIVSNGVSSAHSLPASKTWTATTYSTAPTVSASTHYLLMYINSAPFSGYCAFYYDTGDTNQGHYDSSNNYTTPQNLGTATHSTKKYGIYATYTASGGARRIIITE